jgi:hypothetical protein
MQARGVGQDGAAVAAFFPLAAGEPEGSAVKLPLDNYVVPPDSTLRHVRRDLT